jgi:hypothetical protein
MDDHENSKPYEAISEITPELYCVRAKNWNILAQLKL